MTKKQHRVVEEEGDEYDDGIESVYTINTRSDFFEEESARKVVITRKDLKVKLDLPPKSITTY